MRSARATTAAVLTGFGLLASGCQAFPHSPPISVPTSPPSEVAPPPGPPAPTPGPTPDPTPTPTSTPTPDPPAELAVSTVTDGLAAPWALDFLPDGSALVTERDSGRILQIAADGTETEVGVIEADGENEGGLLGIAVSPAFAEDQLVYAYFSTADDNRVVRFPIDDVDAAEVVIDGIPVGPIHNGGRLAFGPDGLLYIATGDASSDPDTTPAQDPASLAGKILRLTADGEVPADNPIAGSPVYSLGHRNVQGLAWDATGRLFASELGQNTTDELNLIQAGANYGWAEVEGPGGAPDFVDPVATWTVEEASPSGIAVLQAGAIPQFEGDVLVAALRGQRLWRVDLDAAGAVAGQDVALDGVGRLRAVEQAPDGSLWILTSNCDGRGECPDTGDQILRLGPTG